MGHFRRLRARDWFEDEGAPGAPFLFLELTLPRRARGAEVLRAREYWGKLRAL